MSSLRVDIKEANTGVPAQLVENTSGKELLKLADGKTTIMVNKDSLKGSDELLQQNILVPISFSSGMSFNSSLSVQFRIMNGLCNQIRGSYLQLQVKNTDGTNAVTVAQAPFLIFRIDICVDGTVTPVQSLYPEQLFGCLQYYSDEQVANLNFGNQLNMSSSTYATPTSIAKSGYSIYTVPLTGCLLNGLNPKLIKSDIVVNVFYATSPITTGTGTPVINSTNLILMSRKNEPQDEQIYQLSRRYISMIDYTAPVQFSWTGTITASVLTDIPLQSVSGIPTSMLVMFRSSKAFASDAYATFASLGDDLTKATQGTIDLVDQSKASLTGGQAALSAYYRSQCASFHTRGRFSSLIANYWIHFSPNPEESIKHGTNQGHIHLTGNEFLRVTPSADWSSGTFFVDVFVFNLARIAERQDGTFQRVL